MRYNRLWMNEPATRWLPHRKCNPGARLRLFCFPYAGGGAVVYRKWSQSLPATVEVCPVELPGRASRLQEPPFTKLLPLVHSLAQAIRAHLDKPFAFFGHSMGGVIGFELARHLRDEYGFGPSHLFVSGCPAPEMVNLDPPTFNLPEPEFFEELRRLNGTPKEVLEHPELMQLMLPLLRADFELTETYVYSSGRPLDCPISAFGGLRDDVVSREQLEAWLHHTSAGFSLRMFPGDHFFLQTAQTHLLRVLSDELCQLVRRVS